MGGRLNEKMLTAQNMTVGTRRWGFIAKNCPGCSRFLFAIIMTLCFAGLGVAASCPTTDEWDDPMCAAPPVLREADPTADFGSMVACWGLIAFLGCRTDPARKGLPFLYEPIPETEKSAQEGACRRLCGLF